MPPLSSSDSGTLQLTHGWIEQVGSEFVLVLPLSLWAQQVMTAFDEVERHGFQVLDETCRTEGDTQVLTLRRIA